MIRVGGAVSAARIPLTAKNVLRALTGPEESESFIVITLALPSERLAAAAASRASISAFFRASTNAIQRAVAVAARVALNETSSMEVALFLTAPSTMAPALPTATSNETLFEAR